MQLIDSSLTEQPVTISDYSTYELQTLPKTILGFQIKSKFDEERLHFKPEHNAKRIRHFIYATDLEPLFFYGVEIEFQSKYAPLLNSLNNFTSTFIQRSSEEIVGKYKALLLKHGLSCDDCYCSLLNGVYPIDLQHLGDLLPTDTSIPVHNVVSMLEIGKEQWYLNFGAVGIYVLANCGSYGLNFS